MQVECLYPVDGTMAPGCDSSMISKIAKGKMHEQPRWSAREGGDGGGRVGTIS